MKEHMTKNLHSVIFNHTGTEKPTYEAYLAFLESARTKLKTEGLLTAAQNDVSNTLVCSSSIFVEENSFDGLQGLRRPS